MTPASAIQAAVRGTALVALRATSLAQIALWAAAFVWCGEFADCEEAFYHSAVNGSLMLGLSAALLFAVMGRIRGTAPASSSSRWRASS